MANEFLGERRKGLEEAYFANHNRKLIARLREEGGPPPEGASLTPRKVLEEEPFTEGQIIAEGSGGPGEDQGSVSASRNLDLSRR
jgi:hypothetical protein